MRIASAWTFVMVVAISAVHAQTEQAASSADPVRTYTLLREGENWSFLKNPSLRHDPWDRFKYISLGRDGWFLTIGGEAREAFEQVGNDH